MKDGRRCDLPHHYDALSDPDAPKIAKKISRKIRDPVLKRWKDYARHPRPGKKDMTAGPLEEGIRQELGTQLTPLGATVHSGGRKFIVFGEGSEEVWIIADVLIEKDGSPTAIISVKSWLGAAQIRETFAYAYLSKVWHGQRYIRVYMVTLQSWEDSLDNLIHACRPYLDGVFSLSEEPYIDELVEELRDIYGS